MITIYTAENIEVFGETELLQSEWLEDIFSLSDEIARERLIISAESRAKEIGCLSGFKRLVSAHRKELAKMNKDNKKVSSYHGDTLNFETNQYGKPLPTIANFLKVFRNDNRFDGLKFNMLTYSPEKVADSKTVRWTDADDAATREYIERKYKFHSLQKCDDALRILFSEREYNPAIELINSIEWDGQPRINTLLVKWLKCDDTEYTREVSRLIFAGGIHRLYNPGCKFDDVPVLIGTKQGEGKSTFVRWLAMRDEFFTEVNEIEGQKGMEAIEGAWVCEMGELLALTRAKDVEAVKSFITRLVDHYRRPYDRRTSDYKRQCIFIGTTNKEQFLTDKTGNRRWYPIRVNQSGYELFDHAKEVKDDIRQSWAEAKHIYEEGNLDPYSDRKLLNQIRQAQLGAVEDDFRVGMIEDYIQDKDMVCVLELWKNALQNNFSKPTKKESNEIGLIMQSMSGWEKTANARRTKDFGVQKVWEREEDLSKIFPENALPL